MPSRHRIAKAVSNFFRGRICPISRPPRPTSSRSGRCSGNIAADFLRRIATVIPTAATIGASKKAGRRRVAEEKIIDLESDQYFMAEALRQATRVYQAEEVPVGAVIVRDGRIIARAYNQVELLKDATAHAEMLAITQAEAVVGDWRLTDCTLYITKEPCPMCAGAI